MAGLHYYGPYWDREDARSAMGAARSYLYPLYSGKPPLDLESASRSMTSRCTSARKTS